MPVVITGADELVGAAVVTELAGHGLDLRATVGTREAVAPLVARRVKTAVWREGDDVERLGAVFEDAHTVLHLRGGARHALDTVDDVLGAAEDSGVRRIVTLAPLGRPVPEALRQSGYDVIVLRVDAVAHDGRVEPVHPGARRVAPIALADLVTALLAADRLRELHGYRELDAVGPEPVVLRRGLLRRRTPPQEGDGGIALAEVLGVRPVGFRPTP